MMHTLRSENLNQWRDQARSLLAARVTPLEVTWAEEAQPALFGEQPLPTPPRSTALTVPPEFLEFAHTIACHRDVRRWDLLYQLLFRLQHGEKHLMRIATDPLMHALHMMYKAIRRDAHKAKAFVRFRKVMEEDAEHYIAYHCPDHAILPLVAPFFSRRFNTMIWTILTPQQSVHWDGTSLHYGHGAPAEQTPQEDALEDLWRDYYRATFNPARIKINMMKREMPVRYWKGLPETQIIADMLSEAPARVQNMLQHSQKMESADSFLPAERTLPQLRDAAASCKACELHCNATQTVFGTGPINAQIMLVGEQPGDEEDRGGMPFIGPAGRLLDNALDEIGLDRQSLYITNAVKHFRFLYQDSFRHHQSPSRYHVQACKPWLDAEIATVQPRLIICLGNTAARSLIQPNFVMRDSRAKLFGSTPLLSATYHPSAILRAPASQHAGMYKEFTADLAQLTAMLR